MRSNIGYQLAGVCILTAALMIAPGQATAQNERGSLSLSVTAEKPSYCLGELVGLQFRINNVSAAEVATVRPGVARGNVRLFISDDGRDFHEYSGPGWGLSGTGFQSKITLAVAESSETTATLLYNHRTATEHLSELYAQKIRGERIDTEFALAHSGSYWLKAIFQDEKTAIESEPFELVISEPPGSESVVWESIKDDGDMAYFLHTGEIREEAGTRAAEEFISNLRRLIDLYPGSLYTERLRSLLAQYEERTEAKQP